MQTKHQFFSQKGYSRLQFQTMYFLWNTVKYYTKFSTISTVVLKLQNIHFAKFFRFFKITSVFLKSCCFMLTQYKDAKLEGYSVIYALEYSSNYFLPTLNDCHTNRPGCLILSPQDILRPWHYQRERSRYCSSTTAQPEK